MTALRRGPTRPLALSPRLVGAARSLLFLIAGLALGVAYLVALPVAVVGRPRRQHAAQEDLTPNHRSDKRSRLARSPGRVLHPFGADAAPSR
jgi:hypothetical protein